MTDKNKKHTVEIPEAWLLILAVHGNMGEGEIPDFMRSWAEQECKRLGLMGEFRKLQEEKIEILKQRLSAVLGKKEMDWLEKTTEEAAQAIAPILRKNQRDTKS